VIRRHPFMHLISINKAIFARSVADFAGRNRPAAARTAGFARFPSISRIPATNAPLAHWLLNLS